jgi:hypothetical protein
MEIAWLRAISPELHLLPGERATKDRNPYGPQNPPIARRLPIASASDPHPAADAQLEL